MERSSATAANDTALFTIKAEYPVFFIFLSGIVFIIASQWIKNLPGKIEMIIAGVLLLLFVAYFFVVEVKFFAGIIALRRPMFFGFPKSYAAADVECVRIVNNPMTKSMTRVDVVFRKGSRPRKIKQYAYKSEPRALYELLCKNCTYTVELQLN